MSMTWKCILIALGALSALPTYSFAEDSVKGPNPVVVAAPSQTEPVASSSEHEFYISLFMAGNLPANRPLRLDDAAFSNTSVSGGLGGGLKIGMFPGFTSRIIGVEAEVSGLVGDVAAPQATGGGGARRADFTLNTVNAMVNVLARYPGEVWQPYLGAGLGLSGGFARGIDIQSNGTLVNQNAGDAAFAYQLLGGMRILLSERWFVFSEYKYFVANYTWQSELPDGSAGPSFSLPFRTHVVSGGVGFRF